MTEIESAFEWYLKNQDALVEKYNGKVLAIVDQEVVGVYDCELDAFKEMIESRTPGTFMIQRCSPGERDYSATFRSRVSFA